MTTFLQILLAVALVIGFLVLAAFLWLRRWLRRSMKQSIAANELLDPNLLLAPRIRLQADTEDGPGEGLRAQWPQWHTLGFRKLGDFSEAHGRYSVVRLAVHPQQQLGLVLTETWEDQINSVLFAVTIDKHVLASATGLGKDVSSTALSWTRVDDALAPEARIHALLELCQGTKLRGLDVRTIRAAFEQAYALQMDMEIANGAPTAEEIRNHAERIGKSPSEALIRQAHESAGSQWRMRMEEAVLDNWRRATRVDAVRWETLQDHLQVVDKGIDEQTLGDLICEDELSERLYKQYLAQGLSGLALYERVQQGLPAHRRRKQVGEVRRPLPARLYSRDDEAEPECEDAEHGTSNNKPGARAYGYQGTDDSGASVHGNVLALDAADAHRQLQAMGIADASIVTEPNPGESIDPLQLDPDLAALAVRSIREPLWMSVSRSLLANAWIWLPPLLLLAWSLRVGPPYSWGDWVIFAYGVLAAAAMVVLVAPMLVYNQLLRAKLMGQWTLASACMSLLRRLNVMGGLSTAQLLAERCKILAGRGRAREALALWQTLEAELPADQYCNELAQIHDAAGDVDAMIDAQRRLVDLSEDKATPQIDLAMSLARFKRAANDAEDLLAQVPVGGLTELGLCGYHYTRGLILAERDQHSQALNQYQQAISKAAQFRSIPSISGLIAEINGYAALSLRARGDQQQAYALWRSVAPLLKLSASSRGLVARYERGDKRV